MAIELLEQALPEGGPHILALDRHPLPPRHPLGRPQPDTHHEVPAEEGVLIQEDQLQVSIPGRLLHLQHHTSIVNSTLTDHRIYVHVVLT